MTTHNHDALEESACFAADGHVTDLIVTCLADGELALVPAAAAAHVDACDPCTARLGSAALYSVGATDALRAAAVSGAERTLAAKREARPRLDAPRDIARVAPLPAPVSRRRRPLPLGAITAALFVALLGSAPGWMDTLRSARGLVPNVVHALPVVSHTLEAVLRSILESHGGMTLRWMVAAVFTGAGALLARSMSRKQLMEGGVG